MVLVYSGLDYLADGAADRAVFDRMVALRMRDPRADLSPLAADLGAGARGLYELAVNDDPARFADLFARLPEAMRADIEQLDLARHDLKPLQARLLLVHGRNDNLIPWPESLALAAAVPAGHARVFLIQRVLGHVDLSVSSLFTWRFWREDLPDLWRLWRVVDLLLAEREADS
jgi:pimeloyl-ACP methyl ester carboxylesterase